VWFGHFDSPKTHAEFAAFKAKWEALGRELPTDGEEWSFTVADLVALYLQHAEVYYRRPDGTPTHETTNIRYTARPLLELFSGMAVSDFDLRCLKRVRDHMIDSGLARSTVNNRICRVVRFFGWGAEEEFVPPEVYGALRSLRPLKRGRSRAPETDPVEPVEWQAVAAVLDQVSTPVSAMILLQWHTGMRPGEVIQLRPVDLDREGDVWLYYPGRHKTEHHGRKRVVALGPRAQEVLRPFLHRVPKPDPDKTLFSPQESMAERHKNAREERATPMWPSHRRSQARRKCLVPKRSPREAYSVETYRRAIHRGCTAAIVEGWTPNQLRHAAATRIRKQHGLEAARVVLGHTSAAVTEVYADLDEQKAVQVMAELG
jgi:integrase